MRGILLIVVWGLALLAIYDFVGDNRFVMFALGGVVSIFMTYLFIYIDRLEIKNKDN